ncbi:hypothetical protein [Bradyrhizobium sp. USDA 4502]
MKAFWRTALLVAVLLLTATLSWGGSEDAESFGIIGSLLLTFWSLPTVMIVAILDGIERRTGPRVRNVIASLGLVPLLLFPFAPHHDPGFASLFLVPGLVWFVGWLLTSALLVPERE